MDDQTTAQPLSNANLSLAAGVLPRIDDSDADLNGRMIRLQRKLRSLVISNSEKDSFSRAIVDIVVEQPEIVGAFWLSNFQNEQADTLVVKIPEQLKAHLSLPELVKCASAKALASGEVGIEKVELIRGMHIVSVPVSCGEEQLDVLSMLVMRLSDFETFPTILAQMISQMSVVWSGRGEIARLETAARNTAAVVELIGMIEQCETHQQSCMMIANVLKDHLKCQYVIVGGISNRKSKCKVHTMSGLADFDTNSVTVRNVQAALDESTVRDSLTSWPPASENDRHTTMAHRKLAEYLRCEAVVSVPLRNSSRESVGCVLLAGSRHLAMHDDTRFFVNALSLPVGCALQTAKLAQGSPVHRAIRKAVAKSNLWMTIGVVMFAFFLAMFIPMPYQIACKCTAEPVMRRSCVAPYEGLLENTFVEPGDRVTKGELIARMDGHELRLRLASATAQRHRAEKKRDNHSARHEVPDAIMAKLEMDQLQNETELLRFRERNLNIVSPIDGIVLSGNVERRQNYPVTTGQLIYEIAPLDVMRLEVEIPASEVSHIRSGMKVRIRMEGVSQSVSANIKRIRPRSEVRSDQNAFVAEVEIDNSSIRLRPGMHGNARIIADRHTIGWNLFHRPWEHIITTLGF